MQTADEVQVGREIQSTPTLYLLIPDSHVNEGSIPTFVDSGDHDREGGLVPPTGLEDR